MSGNLPVILIELVLVLGGVLAFAWWQLRSVRRDREATARQRDQDRRAEANSDTAAGSPDERRP